MKTKRKFLVVYQWDEETNQYILFVPGLQGCQSLGDTVEEARAHIPEVVQLWLAVATEYPSEMPATYYEEVEVEFDSSLSVIADLAPAPAGKSGRASRPSAGRAVEPKTKHAPSVSRKKNGATTLPLKAKAAPSRPSGARKK